MEIAFEFETVIDAYFSFLHRMSIISKTYFLPN